MCTARTAYADNRHECHFSEILCTKQCLYILGHHRHHCQLRINTLGGQERWTHWPSVLLQGWQVELLRFFCFNIDARFL